MLSRAIVLAGVLLVAGCAVGERPTLTDEAITEGDGDGSTADGVIADGGASAATIAPGSATTGNDDEPDDVSALGDAPPVLVTPTGVVVAVAERTAAGYRVTTPCGNDGEIRWGLPVDPVDVVLDPGHGGDEQGALGPGGATESEVNLDVARRTAALLERDGISVALTRTADYRVTIPNRAAIAARLDAAVLVSIHHNSPNPDISENRSAPGTEVYVQTGSEDSARLGGLVYAEVVDALAVFDAEWASRTDAGVLNVINDAGEDAYGIVRRPPVPTALVEMAYLSNPTEELVIGTTEYREAAAGALAVAISRFLGTADVGSGFVDEPRLFNPSGDTGGSEGCTDPALE